MSEVNLRDVIRLGKEAGYAFVATADGSGLPHVAVARKLNWIDEDVVGVSEWFCPGTVANLYQNRLVSVVVWAAEADSGFQLLGAVERVDDSMMMDGYAKEFESVPPMPQAGKTVCGSREGEAPCASSNG